MPLSNYSIDKFVAQDMSKITDCAPQMLADEFPDRIYFFENFVLRRILHNHVHESQASLAITMIRKAEAALDEWDLACHAAPDVKKISGYFKMLRHLESSLAALWQGLEISRKALGIKLFEKGDSSIYDRLNSLYNTSRHFDPYALPSSNLHPVWITNDGLNSAQHKVTFVEMREEIKTFIHIVRQFAGNSQQPTSENVPN